MFNTYISMKNKPINFFFNFWCFPLIFLFCFTSVKSKTLSFSKTNLQIFVILKKKCFLLISSAPFYKCYVFHSNPMIFNMKDKLNRILKSPFVTLKKDLFCNTHHFNQCKELQLLFKRFWIIWYFLYNFSSFNTELRSFFFYPFFIFLIDSMFFFVLSDYELQIKTNHTYSLPLR